MFKKVLFAFIMLHVWVIVLDIAGVYAQDDSEKIWVYREYTGGSQCSDDFIFPKAKGVVLPGANSNEAKPQTPKIKAKPKVHIYDEFKHHLKTCSACGCPTYSYNHYKLINKSDLANLKGHQEPHPKQFEYAKMEREWNKRHGQ